MTSRLTALQASFVADSLSLGPHWVYNQSKVARLYPDGVISYDDPRSDYQAPSILVGHSLGGAAVLAAAAEVPECRGVVTIGAPADPAHIIHLLGDGVAEIKAKGVAEISLAGRPFRVGQRFLDDLETACQPCAIADLKRDLLVMHAPQDAIVGIDNARQIYESAKHPKSFISLDSADHLLANSNDSQFAATIIAAWASRLS